MPRCRGSFRTDPHAPIRSRGAALVLVVALLVLLALVSALYLKSVWLARLESGTHVAATHKHFAEHTAREIVAAAIRSDLIDPTAIERGAATTVRAPAASDESSLSTGGIDSALNDPFLADRVPILQWTLAPADQGPAVVRPVWRCISWLPAGSAAQGDGWRVEMPNSGASGPNSADGGGSPSRVELISPYRVGVAYKKGQIVMLPAERPGGFDCFIRTDASPGTVSDETNAPTATMSAQSPPLWARCHPKQYFTFAPTQMMLAGGPQPAFYVFNNYVAADVGATDGRETVAPYVVGPIPAADADGDGIADALYARLPMASPDGLTYFFAARIIDHNSAINLNTAWAADADFDFDPASPEGLGGRVGTLVNYGFFPSNIGLREMFHSFNQPNAMGEPSAPYGLAPPLRYHAMSAGDPRRLAEITRHNLFRFGGMEAPGGDSLGLAVASEAGGQLDWRFRSQGEALWTQLNRRPGNPGIGDINPPDGAITAADTPLRWIDPLTDGAALARNGGVAVDPRAAPTALEQRFIDAISGIDALNQIDSLYGSVAGVRGFPGAAGGIAPTSSAPDGTHPAVDRWFDLNFNYDRYRDASRFVMDPEPGTGHALFRTIRPLVVASNPVSNLAGGHTAVAGSARIPEFPGSAAGSISPSAGTYSAMRPYADATAATARVSANTAGFGDLWRAYWNVMAGDWADVARESPLPPGNDRSGTPFEREIRAYESKLGRAILNPYHGGRFQSHEASTEFPPATTESATGPDGAPLGGFEQLPAAPNPPDARYAERREQIEYHPARMFRSPMRSFTLSAEGSGGFIASDFDPPLPAKPPASRAKGFDPALPLPRLRPDQVLLLRSALAAVNTEDLRDTDFKVTRRTILLQLAGQAPDFDTTRVDPAVAVTIFGNEPQPFITEVFAHTWTRYDPIGTGGNAGTGYVAIELHNPYPFPIDIRYCKLATINRFSPDEPAYPGLRVLDTEEGLPEREQIHLHRAESNLNAGTIAGEQYTCPTVIPATGYLVLENYRAAGAGTFASGVARNRPLSARFNVDNLTFNNNGQGSISVAAAGPRMNVAFVANLHRLLNREFVLLRPVDVDALPADASDESDPIALAHGTSEVSAGTRPLNGFVRRRMESVVGFNPADVEGTTVRTLQYCDPVLAPEAADRRSQSPRTPAVDMVPLDSFDFTGLTLPGETEGGAIQPSAMCRGANAWHYVRANESLDTRSFPARMGGGAWRFVYPGRYDATKYAGRGHAPFPLPRQQGTREHGPSDDTNRGSGWERGDMPDPAPALGRPDPVGSSRYALAVGEPIRGEFPIPLHSTGSVPLGIAPVVDGHFYPAIPTTTQGTTAQPDGYPFGGFARLGDLLHVPFIGAYRIQLPSLVGDRTDAGAAGGARGDYVVELNAITMDAVMAEDTDVNDDPIVGGAGSDDGSQSREQIGRFVPLRKTWQGDAEPSDAGENVLYNDMAADTRRVAPLPDGHEAGYAWTNHNRYRWAADLFDYVGVHSPGADFQPDATRGRFAVGPEPVRNTLGAPPNGRAEARLPTEGLVNINTASERVMAMLPWTPRLNGGGDEFSFIVDATGHVEVRRVPDGVADNLQVARAIVRFRQGGENRSDAQLSRPVEENFRTQPFLSIWELYRVPEIAALQSFLLSEPMRGVLNDRVGDISPFPLPHFAPRSTRPQFLGRFFGIGDVVGMPDGSRYVCIRSFKLDATSPPPPKDEAHWQNVSTAGQPRGRFDFEEQTLLLNRVSNLVTPRSDMFTVYLLVEGWANAGTPRAELRYSRRQTYLIDRSQVDSESAELSVPATILAD